MLRSCAFVLGLKSCLRGSCWFCVVYSSHAASSLRIVVRRGTPRVMPRVRYVASRVYLAPQRSSLSSLHLPSPTARAGNGTWVPFGLAAPPCAVDRGQREHFPLSLWWGVAMLHRVVMGWLSTQWGAGGGKSLQCRLAALTPGCSSLASTWGVGCQANLRDGTLREYYILFRCLGGGGSEVPDVFHTEEGGLEGGTQD